MRAQAGHRESRSGNSTSLEGEGWHRGRRCCHEAPAGLCSIRAERHGRQCRRLGGGGGGDSFWLSYLPRRSPGTRVSTQDRAASRRLHPGRAPLPGYDGDVGPVRPDPPSKVGVTMAAERAGSLASALSPVPSAAGGSAQAAASWAARLALRC